MSSTYRSLRASVKIVLLMVVGTTLGLIGILRFTDFETRMDTITVIYLMSDGTRKQEDISWMRRRGAQHYADTMNTSLGYRGKPTRVVKLVYCPVLRPCATTMPITSPLDQERIHGALHNSV